ncbi:MAG: hypothetical protein IKE64_07045 [Thermoguttaceae bacterium]|nr:hypothetical protein [Thermoguttaceae bacterium]
MKRQNAITVFTKNEPAVRGRLGSCYRGPETDWDHVISAMKTIQVLFGKQGLEFGAISGMSTDEFQAHQKEFRSDAILLKAQMNAIEKARDRVKQWVNHKVLDLDTNSYNDCISKFEACLADFEMLGNWLNFWELIVQMKAHDLLKFVDLLITKKIDPRQMTGTFRRVFYRKWIENILFSDPELRGFSRIPQDQTVQKFAEKDGLHYKISKAQIKAELSQDRPSLDIMTGGSAVSVLRGEGRKKRKQMPIRKLFAETGSLVQKIKPCFLMSPLSVSTFLDPDAIQFDTVIFDEASQIFLEDAISVIYRGKQLIVVGDSKQMPPSNFFNSSTSNDDDDEEYDDVSGFESILDKCSATFTEKQLAWHYRSHYEQLITFSNLHFYNNNLITFPSSTTDHEGIGVDYYHVTGVFDRKSKTNRVEAEFIVDLIYRHIKEYPNRSLGVVAFSIAQQNLIDKLLSKKREEDPSYEEFFRPDREEPFFIKNLETVQGDERDTIIFSIAYAKDSQGRFIQNFGPLNRQGGERRLNVAVTRAKDNVQLVASIHHTDLSNTASEGVRLLRAYLDYAENGERALERTTTVSGQDHFDSDFEQEVCDFLRNNGYTVDTQVGCSGYRIDLGLRKPDSSNYLLAIECDGATYHRSKNARDRDVLRQRILENMGWTFYRVWSTDWFQNPMVEKELLLNAAKDAVSRADTPKGDIEKNAQCISEQETPEPQFSTEIQESSFSFPEYKQTNAEQVLKNHSFSLQSAIFEILETEAPLSEEFLLKRIASILFDTERVTKSVKDEFNHMMLDCESKGVIRRHGFLYLHGQEINDIKLRVPGDQRDIGYISIEEIANGFYTLIEQNVSASKEGLYKKMNDLLGFSRTGVKIKKRYDEALRTLIDNGRVIVEEDMLKIK